MASKKITLYLPPETCDALYEEAERLDRPISWVLRTAWNMAHEDIRAIPGPDETPEGLARAAKRNAQ